MKDWGKWAYRYNCARAKKKELKKANENKRWDMLDEKCYNALMKVMVWNSDAWWGSRTMEEREDEETFCMGEELSLIHI